MTEPRSCPALMVCAPASGHGKTSLTAGLARYHSRRGLKVRCFKTGPDFIDPSILARASGQEVYNLDSWIMGEAHCRQLLYQAAQDSDLILVEGVMGLFDGEPSSADLAELFGLPLLPVIDASAMAQTFAAIVHGLRSFRPTLTFAGVVANRVGSARHRQLLHSALANDLPLSCLPRQNDASLPGRHLGLQLADEIEHIDSILDLWAERIADTPLAQLPPPVGFAPPPAMPALPRLLAGRRIAVARDRAFCFVYPQNLHCLRQLGAELVFFSPLAQQSLPQADAVYLPGGYPELYAGELAANQGLKQALHDHAAQGGAIVAECGGMLYLLQELIDGDSQPYPLAGLLPGQASMNNKLTAIGAQQVTLNGQEIRGHTFHYSSATLAIAPAVIANTADGRSGEAVYRLGPITASYLHWYFATNPALTAELFSGEAC